MVLSIVEGCCGCIGCCNFILSIVGLCMQWGAFNSMTDNCSGSNGNLSLVNAGRSATNNIDCQEAVKNLDSVKTFIIVITVFGLIFQCVRSLLCLFGAKQTMDTKNDLEKGGRRRDVDSDSDSESYSD